MDVVDLRAFGSAELHAKLGNPKPSINVNDVRAASVRPKYESEEEEVSETEASNRSESVFSPVENDSDTGASESEEMGLDSPKESINREHSTPEHIFALEIPTSSSGPAISRTGSINTVKRASCITLMPPIQPRPNDSSSASASPLLSGVAEPIFVPSHVTEEEAIQYYRSFYSDAVSSDDEYGLDNLEASFLVATPISFYVPDSKPHLISIEPPGSYISKRQTTRRRKKQDSSPLSREVSPKSSPRSPSSISIKNRVSGLRKVQHSKRRDSTALVPESASPIKTRFSNASVPSLSDLTWRANSVPASNYETEPESSATPRNTQDSGSTRRKHTLLPSPRFPRRDSSNKHQKVEKPVENKLNSQEHSGREDGRRTRKWKKKSKVPPVPQLTGIAISPNVPSPLSSATSPDSPGSVSLQSHPPMAQPLITSNGGFRRNSNGTSSSLNSSPPSTTTTNDFPNLPLPDESSSTLLYPPTKRRGFHERTQSISSLASTTSMPNYPNHPFPNTSSPRSATHRYRDRFYPTNTYASARPPSFENVSPVPKPFLHNAHTFAPHGSISTTNLSNISSESAATSRSNSRSDVNSMSWNRYTGTWSPSGTPVVDRGRDLPRKHARSKSIKRLYETSETVSRAGSKAINGLGSMLRKKNAASGDDGWNSSRVI
ncbi:hypothetical protein AJ79_07525 [Helicocarpus griseus UAMH5409]|uniref:Uncharacterized protein n=1 Tax=Helicocarpus griseus UAMH5409 TaxID=1447875 RepID=A0A2B7X1V9_9EURO|nr:hypothetical protein AJ79_07525 [Helicocarpus griseus UAMH5409]